MRKSTRQFLTASALTAATTLAMAVPITVSNFSFENPDTTTYNTGPITSWTISSGNAAGVFQPDAYKPVGGLDPNVGAGFIAGVYQTQTAYINAGYISQTLTDMVTAGTYTLRVNVGDRRDNSSVPNYSIQLFGGASVLATITNADFATVNDGWVETTLTYTSLSSTSDLLGLRLSKVSGSQVNFDNVRLDFTPATPAGAVPEPATLALVGLALVGLGALRRRG